jgi:hypothetical protein
VSVSVKQARKLAKRIYSDNRKGRSYRIIAKEDYPGLKAGTLNRFAKSKGEYVPKDKNILKILGLIKPRKFVKKERPEFMKTWSYLPIEERWNVIKLHLENKKLLEKMKGKK